MPRGWRRKSQPAFGSNAKNTVKIKLRTVLRGRRVEKAVAKKAAEIEAYWKSIAPVFGATGRPEHREAPPRGAAGDYRDSIRTTTKTVDGIPMARVQPHDWKTKMIEYGAGEHFPVPTQAPKATTLARFKK